jgi:hypothetical protein
MPRGNNPNSRKNLKPVQKGEVRNPKGINRKRPYTDRMFAHGEELLANSADGLKLLRKYGLSKDTGWTWADLAIHNLLMRAARGEVREIKELADRIEGKSPERLEITGPERKEITIRIKHDREE